MPDTTKPTGPKDVFTQLLLIVALYLAATHLGALVFQLINHWMPDPTLEGVYVRERTVGTVRWAIAMLIVTTPVFFGITWHLRKEFERVPEKLVLRSRRWLTAFTLFGAAVVAIGDLITVIHEFLQGELTTRFLLKALVVLVIAGAVFWYERWEFRRESGGRPPTHILALRWGAIVGVVAAVAAGFVVTGSPWTARVQRIDAERLQHLSSIQSQVVQHWQRTSALPANLDVLRDDIGGFTAPVDPQTNAPYEYRITSERSFELCSTFATAGDGSRRYRGYPYMSSEEQWLHGIGRTCFTRTIDPARYPSRIPKPPPAN
ncbi:MAG: DUF5671 domain-containing protein [bacterium]|nr:DUF5671 domain-containing protein [bacterium]